MNEVIETKNLTKRYGKKTVADNVAMTVRRGDIYGFIGKNGAGKTTVMKLISGLSRPTEGEVSLFGGENLCTARRKIGVLIETPGLFKSCSAYENMKRFACLTGDGDAEINELLEFAGLGDVGKKAVGKFSLGMKQRLGIAVAMLGNPELLILDEPVNGLDPEGMKEVRDLVVKLNREKGVTFLISSHFLDELSKIVTRYGIIRDGKLVEEISVEELDKRVVNALKIVVDDGEKAETALIKSGILKSDIVRSGNELLLPVDSSAPQIVAALVKGGAGVYEATMLRGDKEKYLIDRMGD